VCNFCVVKFASVVINGMCGYGSKLQGYNGVRLCCCHFAIGVPYKNSSIGSSCVAMRMNKKQPLHSSSSSMIMVSNFFSI